MVWWLLTNIYSHNHHNSQNMEYFSHPEKFPQFKFVGANCRQAFPSNRENSTICSFSFLALYIIASLTSCPTAGYQKSWVSAFSLISLRGKMVLCLGPLRKGYFRYRLLAGMDRLKVILEFHQVWMSSLGLRHQWTPSNVQISPWRSHQVSFLWVAT